MGKYVNEQIAKAARSTGTLIGKTEPCRETKGSWWEVYVNKGELTACVMAGPDWVSCGESLPSTELHLYVDDVEAAQAALEAAEAAK